MYRNDRTQKLKNRSVNCWKGSYTVEAAVIVPVTVFVMAALIIASFYLHDRGIMQSAACETAAAGSNFETVEERQKATGKIKDQITENRLLGSHGLKKNISVGAKETNAAFLASCSIPGIVVPYFSKSTVQIQRSWQGKKTDPADMIRKVLGAEHVITG